MLRKLTPTLGLALAVMVPRPASADTITPLDLDGFAIGALLGPALIDQFSGINGTNGDATTRVFYDGSKYVYTQTIFPTNDFNLSFRTEFDVVGFTGEAGWSFAESGAVGAGGNANDFRIEETATGSLVWVSLLGGAFGDWNAFEPGLVGLHAAVRRRRAQNL
jgi:hypothetical protein